MAETAATKTSYLQQLTAKQKIAAAVAGVALVSALVVGTVASGAKDYKILFAGVSEKDGGAIIAALDQMQVPYQFSSGGGAILVPAEKVHEVRLRLATQGLPKGGGVGFEVMEKQGFGVSHFAERVNYQRGLEGELGKTISSIQFVAGARVHLSIPKQSAFVREGQKPSASVFLNIQPGRTLDRSQIVGIANLVASAVPDLRPQSVSILDQNGTPLNGTEDAESEIVDGRQLAYQRKIESDYVKEIESLLEPMVGKGNIRAKVRVDLDFAKIEQTEEMFNPNGDPTKASIRSSQNMENSSGAAPAGGIPGAVSNVPPGSASAPDKLPPGPDGKPSLPPLPNFSATPTSSAKTSTTNFEVDRTVRHIKRSTGGVQRLSVAVLVNNKTVVDDKGVATSKPLTADEITKIKAVVRDAVGVREDRKDSIEVLNTEFAVEKQEPIEVVPAWKDPENLSLAATIAKALGIFAVIAYLLLGVVRPMMRKVLKDEPQPEFGAGAPGEPGMVAMARDEDGVVTNFSTQQTGPASEAALSGMSEFERARIKAAQVAKKAPDAAAQIVQDWVSGGDA